MRWGRFLHGMITVQCFSRVCFSLRLFWISGRSEDVACWDGDNITCIAVEARMI